MEKLSNQREKRLLILLEAEQKRDQLLWVYRVDFHQPSLMVSGDDAIFTHLIRVLDVCKHDSNIVSIILVACLNANNTKAVANAILELPFENSVDLGVFFHNLSHPLSPLGPILKKIDKRFDQNLWKISDHLSILSTDKYMTHVHGNMQSGFFSSVSFERSDQTHVMLLVSHLTLCKKYADVKISGSG